MHGWLSRFAAYVVAHRDLPVSEPEKESARKRIVDLLIAARVGIDASGVQAVTRAASLFGSGDTPIWFTGGRGSAVGAAWANSAAASALDLDDGNRLARGHPGAAIIPVALAVAAQTGATQDALLAAIVIGYEVGVAVGAARMSYGSTGAWAVYGVVAAAAALRHTSMPVLEHALAIGGESAPNQRFSSMPPGSLPTPEGSDIKEGIPWSVVTGLTALTLAEAGFTGPRNLLESSLHYRFVDERPLGQAQHLYRSYYKLYACCRHIHPPLDALLPLIRQHAIDVRKIDAIEIETYSGALRITNKIDPGSLVDVQYSIPYCLALVALKGPEMLLPVTQDALGHAEVVALAGKVSIALDPAMDARFPAETLARVTVVSQGRRVISAVTAPRGEAHDPLSWEALEAKFLAVARRGVSAAQKQQFLAGMHALRQHRDLGPLQACLASSALL